LPPSACSKRAKPAWYDTPRAAFSPARQRERGCGQVRGPDEVYHFLLPDPGMASYTDKVAKSSTRRTSQRLKTWRTAMNKPLEPHEIRRLQQLSDSHRPVVVSSHVQLVGEDRAAHRRPAGVWPAPPLPQDLGAHAPPRARKRKPAKKACSTTTTTWPRRTAASSW
jgi:hypothetical protein